MFHGPILNHVGIKPLYSARIPSFLIVYMEKNYFFVDIYRYRWDIYMYVHTRHFKNTYKTWKISWINKALPEANNLYCHYKCMMKAYCQLCALFFGSSIGSKKKSFKEKNIKNYTSIKSTYANYIYRRWSYSTSHTSCKTRSKKYNYI